MAVSILFSGGPLTRARRFAAQWCRGTLIWAERLAWTAFFLFALIVLVLRYAVLPSVEQYRPDIEAALTRATGLKVTIGQVKAGWEGLRPDLDLLDVQIHDAKGRKALSLPFVSITLSWWSVPFGQLRLHELDIANADLDIRRSRAGRISIGGIELKDDGSDGQMSDWILGQRRIIIRASQLRWNDELRGAPELALADIHLVASNNGDRHRVGLRGTPPQQLSNVLDLRADFYGASLANLRPWRGEVYADLTGVDLAAWRAWVDYPADIRSGVGSLRTWAGFDTERLTHFTADIALNKALVRLRKDLAPLELSNVQGRIGARELLHPGTGFSFLRFGSRHVTGFEVSGKQVALTTNAGVRLAPADFVMQTIAPDTVRGNAVAMVADTSAATIGVASAGGSFTDGKGAGSTAGAKTETQAQPQIQPHAQAGTPGEIRLQANALNLEPIVKIAELLPLDAQLRKLLIDLDPRGTLHDFNLEWRGDFDHPAGYRVHGRFDDLALNAYRSAPGFSGLSGAVDATEKGGTLTLAGKSSAVLLPLVFEEPRLLFDTLDVKSSWGFPAGQLELKVEQAAFANADAAGQMSATYRAAPDSPGHLDLSGRLTRGEATAVHRYMPSNLSAGLRSWVREAVEAGHSNDVRFKVRGNLYDFPFTDPAQGEFQVAIKLEGGRLFYADKWPRANDIKGDLVFERSGMWFKSRTAGTILGAKIGTLDLRVADFRVRPTLLELSGNAEGPVNEFLKFVDQSPVTGYINGFTAPMRASGQGKLALKLALPLGPAEDAAGSALAAAVTAAAATGRTAAKNVTVPGAATTGTTGAKPATAKPAPKLASTATATANALRINGQYQIINNEILLDEGMPKMERVNGVLAFTERGFELRNIRGEGVGGTFTVAGGSRANNTIGVTAQGNFTVPGVAAWLKDPVFGSMSGGSAWRANINIDASGGEVAVDSSLAGVAIDLPIPLSKPVAEAWPMRFVKTAGAAPGEDEWNFTLGKAITARLQRRVEGGAPRIFRAAVGVNDTMPPLPRTGLALNAAATLVDVDDWRQRAFGVRPGGAAAPLPGGGALAPPVGGTAAATSSAAAAPAPAAASVAFLPAPWQIQVRADTLTAFGRPLHQVRVFLVQEPARWAANLTSNEANGTLSFRPATVTTQGSFQARMKNLIIPAATAHGSDTPFDRIAEDMPAVDLAVEDFQLGDKKLGRLEFDATNIAGEWRIQALNLINPDGALTATGAWRRPVRSPTAGIMRRPIHLDFTLNTTDAGKLLDRLGFPNTVRAGEGYLKGNTGWEGSPMAIDYATLRGDLELRVTKGQFLKADPGAGKLLGIMSLQALPRRLTLDFRDVFSEGFAFDLVSASSKIERGVLATNDFRMNSVSAVILMTGDTDLAREMQNLKVVVLPDLSGGMVSAIGAITGVINPVGALVSFLAQRVLKDPISKAFSFEYAVTGSWADPKIARIQTLPQPQTGDAGTTAAPPVERASAP